MDRIRQMIARGLAGVFFAAGALGASAAPTVTYYHNDLAGSPVAATDSSRNVIWRESYRPYGERLTNSPASEPNDVWFTSRRQDFESGLVYMGARYYDPVVGRFYSTDPALFDEKSVHSFNRYAYGNNNPIRFIDTDGRMPIPIIAQSILRLRPVAQAVHDAFTRTQVMVGQALQSPIGQIAQGVMASEVGAPSSSIAPEVFRSAVERGAPIIEKTLAASVHHARGRPNDHRAT